MQQPASAALAFCALLPLRYPGCDLSLPNFDLNLVARVVVRMRASLC
jgi:hypothetical protein